jgi:hypothetical protein
MRTWVIGLASVPFVLGLLSQACGGAGSSGFGNDGGGSGGASGGAGSGGSGGTTGGSGGSTGSGAGGSTGIGLNSDSGGGGPKDSGVDVIVTTTTTIYAHTDTQLYSLDPMTNNVTVLGTFSGMGGTTYDKAVTDLAVDSKGNIYVNTETVV